MDLERRQSPRYKLNQLAYINLPVANGGIVLDVSEGGLSFHAVAPIQRADVIHFRLAVGAIKDIEASASLAWTDATGKSGGLRFTALPAEVRQQIDGWLSEGRVTHAAKAAEQKAATVRESYVPLAAGSDPAVAENPSRTPILAALSAAVQAETAPPQAAGVEARGPNGHGSGLKQAAQASTEMEAAASESPFTFGSVTLESAQRQEGGVPSMFGLGGSTVSSAREGSTLNPLSMFQENAPDLEVEPRGHSFSIVAAILLLAFVVAVSLAYVYRVQAGAALVWLGQHVSGRSHPAVATQQPAYRIPPPSPPSSALSPPRSSVSAPSAAQPETAKPQTGSLATNANPGSETQSITQGATAKTPRPGSQGQSAQSPTPPAPRVDATGTAANGASSPAVNGATGASTAANPNAAAAAGDYGAGELAEARKYLREAQSPTDTATAAQLLWASIEKGNTDAEVELAGLYARGEGVEKSCEQARVLLTAAANKGNAGAKAKLEELRRTGCF